MISDQRTPGQHGLWIFPKKIKELFLNLYSLLEEEEEKKETLYKIKFSRRLQELGAPDMAIP